MRAECVKDRYYIKVTKKCNKLAVSIKNQDRI